MENNNFQKETILQKTWKSDFSPEQLTDFVCHDPLHNALKDFKTL